MRRSSSRQLAQATTDGRLCPTHFALVQHNLDDQGLTLAITPAQLGAVLCGVDVSASETQANRLTGGLQVLAGSLEMLGAAALVLVPDPSMATKVGGYALAVHGSDTTSAGVWQVWTGRPERTLTHQAAEELALRLGADPNTADRIGTAIDIAVPMFVSAGIGVARITAIRNGRISLIEHEACTGSKIGGHTIAKHVGKTEQELRSRLAQEVKLRAVSSFSSLDVAERVLYKAMRANKAGIEAWARHAALGRAKPFTYTASEMVGHGIVRATGKLVQTRKVMFVMKAQQYGGKLYYILTAFPDV